MEISMLNQNTQQVDKDAEFATSIVKQINSYLGGEKLTHENAYRATKILNAAMILTAGTELADKRVNQALEAASGNT